MFLRTVAVLLSLAVLSSLFSGCSLQRRELSLEASHRFCERYHDDVDWAGYFYNHAYYFPLDSLIPALMKRNDLQVCSGEVVKAEISPNRLENDDRTFVELTFEIRDVYIGDPSITGREVHQLVFQESEDASRLLGNKYLFFVEGVSAQRENLLLYTPWIFLVIENDVLVSPYGCPIEDLNRGNYISMECRSYTGQSLYYFLSEVRKRIRAWEDEAAEAGGTVQ